MVKKLLPVLLLGLLMAGCTTNITNLTPKRESRNPNGFYSIEAKFSSTQQTLRWDSIKPSVIVGNEVYPMRLTSLMTNRWETLVPATGSGTVFYRFKFDYSYNSFGAPKTDSKRSPIYRLQISNE